MDLKEYIKKVLHEQGTPAENTIIDDLRDILKAWEIKDYPSAEVRYKAYYRDIENLIKHTLTKEP